MKKKLIPIITQTVLSGSGNIVYLMQDEFITDRAAGAINGTACEPGPTATRICTDTSNYATITLGELQYSGGVNYGDPGVWLSNVPAGGISRSIFCKFFHGGNSYGPAIGWCSPATQLGIINGSSYFRVSPWNTITAQFLARESAGDTGMLGQITSISNYHELALLARVGGGLFYIYKQGTDYPVYTLLRIGGFVSTYPFMTTISRDCKFSFLRIADAALELPGLATKWGMATDYAEPPTNGQTFTMKKDSYIYTIWTPTAGETLSIYFRRTDDDNTFRLDCVQAAGTIRLYKREGAVDGELDTGKTQTWTPSTAYAIHIQLRGSTIRTYVDRAIKHNTTHAYNLTATGGKITGFTNVSSIGFFPTGTEGEWAKLAGFFADNDLNPIQNVLTIGGSISAGGSSTNPFTTQVRNWMIATYPQRKFQFTYRNLSGRPSWMQLVSNMEYIVADNPALIFIDYAVNDGELFTKPSTLPTESAGAAEALIRVLRTRLPNAVITVGVYTWPDVYSVMDENRRAARDLWLELISRYGLHTGDVLATDIETLDPEPPLTDAEIDQYFPTHGDVHPNDLGHTTISNGFKDTLPTILPELNPQWTPPLPSRYIAESEYFEYTPTIRNGIDNDGETGTGWTTVNDIARQSSTANDTIQWTGTFCSFGLDSNFSTGAGTLAWKLDNGSYSNINLGAMGVATMFVTSFPRDSHTITIKVVSGTVRINQFLAI